MTVAVANGVQYRRPVGVSDCIRTERLMVTPEYAGSLLAKNTKNRTVIKLHLRKIEEALRRGEWVFNGEPVIVSASGRVLDGQHRLMACLNTGIAFDTNVVFGVDESVFDTIDQGSSRTIGNVLDVDGEENYNHIAAALKNFWGFCRTGQIYDGGGWSSSFTARTARELLSAHAGIRDSVRMCLKCEHYKSKSLLAALHYIFKFSNPQFASELIEVVESGGGDKDRPFHVLREHIIYGRMNRIAMGNRSLAAKTIRAFNAEVTGEWVKRLQYKQDGQFPLVVGLDYDSLKALV
jgi:hypothetical protein